MGLDKNIIKRLNSNHMIVRFLLWLYEVITFICIALSFFPGHPHCNRDKINAEGHLFSMVSKDIF